MIEEAREEFVSDNSEEASIQDTPVNESTYTGGANDDHILDSEATSNLRNQTEHTRK